MTHELFNITCLSVKNIDTNHVTVDHAFVSSSFQVQDQYFEGASLTIAIRHDAGEHLRLNETQLILIQ